MLQARSSGTVQNPQQMRSTGNLPANDPRAYPALYGPRPGSYVATPRRSMGNRGPVSTVPRPVQQPTQPAAQPAAQPLGVNPRWPYPGIYPQGGMGRTGGMIPFPAGSASPAYSPRSTGNLSPAAPVVTGNAVPSSSSPAPSRRSMGNRRQ